MKNLAVNFNAKECTFKNLVKCFGNLQLLSHGKHLLRLKETYHINVGVFFNI